MAKSRGIHWLVPATMLGALITGVLLAAGHHLFYQSLDGTRAPTLTASYHILGAKISRQETNTAVGTAFAFLVKASLAFAISIAFVQVFWRTARRPNTQNGPTLASLDLIYSALDNIFTFIYVSTWWKYPVLLLIALSVWLVPVASVITPATLSIQTTAVLPPPSSMVNVPNLDFRSMNFLAAMPPQQTYGTFGSFGQDYHYFYKGPSRAVSEVASAVIAGGAILPIDSPHSNASWHLDFAGPSLKCSPVNETMDTDIKSNMYDYFSQGLNCQNYFAYMAWVPIDGYWKGKTVGGMPFVSESQNGTLVFNNGRSLYNGNIGSVTPADLLPSTLYLTMIPDLLDGLFKTKGFIYPYIGCPNPPREDFVSRLGDIVQCQVHNATYSVDFNYTDGIQNIRINQHSVDLDHPVTAVSNVVGPGPEVAQENCFPPKPGLADSCAIDISTDGLKSLSYQAIMDSFAQRIAGTVFWKTTVAGTADLEQNSDIMRTTLADASDLAFIEQSQQATGSLQGLVSQTLNASMEGLLQHTGTKSNLNLSEMMEAMFKNLTVSLMSSSALQPNHSSITAPAPVNVTSHRYENFYVYSKWKLWTAYGIAIALTAIVLLVGAIAIILNDASYSDSFSTIFRVARDAHVTVDVKAEDLDGRDPLPGYLGDARVVFGILKDDDSERNFHSPTAQPSSPQVTPAAPEEQRPMLDLRDMEQQQGNRRRPISPATW